ncbi:F-box/leucine rich repeat protein, putative [Entamoeba invadens IP1]|uniref:F-box/leucine rich repeat protein, putative n=1 Tax=Entamoeba invadens IP1 TaxID=370355 RepID=A0A0A1TUH3_ENTIV|nr:F-box/leucine rich repeat protein, putative [Entamoeba invadens IP1]ELP83680.1 F-box/leucine rich repeat protein, putative [Entamoeba invadens IP1]|eukprot:XP_004183026.1 F-box/leucine rich repeat protein, putative [Entamoeba invadens IP1]
MLAWLNNLKKPRTKSSNGTMHKDKSLKRLKETSTPYTPEKLKFDFLEEKDVQRIFRNLSFHDLLMCRSVSKKWRDSVSQVEEINILEPIPKIATVFPNITKLAIDPNKKSDPSELLLGFSKLTSLKCRMIPQNTANKMTTLRNLDCPDVEPPKYSSYYETDSIKKVAKYHHLVSLSLNGVQDRDIDQISKLTNLQKLSINSRKFVGKIESLVDVSQLTSLEITGSSLSHEFFYNLYLFPKLFTLKLNKCILPLSTVPAQTPLSQLGPKDGFIYLIGCNALHILNITSSNVSEYHMEVIGRLRHLRVVSFKGCTLLTDNALLLLRESIVAGNILELNLSDTLISHIGLQVVSSLKNLRVLDISNCGAIKVLSPLDELKNLEILKMKNVEVNKNTLDGLLQNPSQHLKQITVASDSFDDALVSLCCTKIPSLKVLNLEHSHITTKGLESLEIIPFIRFIDLSSTEVKDEVFGQLSKALCLESIVMKRCLNITGEGIKQLKTLYGLRVLNLNGCKQLTDSAIEEMKELTVETLRISTCPNLSSAIYKHLVQLKYLKRVDMSFNNLNDDGIEELKKCTWLEVVYLFNTHVTEKSVKLLLTLPNIRKIDAKNCGIQTKFKENCVVCVKTTKSKTKRDSKKEEEQSDDGHNSADSDKE